MAKANIIQFEQLKRKLVRFDGFTDFMSAAGMGSKFDIMQGMEWRPAPLLSVKVLRSMYVQHELAAKIVDMLPDDATREWVDFQAKTSRRIKRLEPILRELLTQPQNGDMSPLKASRLDGGSPIYMECAGLPDEPITGPTEIYQFHVIEKEYLYPVDIGRTLSPEYYRMVTAEGQEVIVHKSRIIPVQGEILPKEYMLRNLGWGGSCLERPSKPLVAYSLAHGSVPQILKDFIRDIIKVDGLKDLALNMDSSDLRSFQDKMTAIKLGLTMYNAAVVDGADEWIRETANITGIEQLIRNPERALVASTPYPHTKLLNESPGGTLSQAGTSQEKDYNRTVRSYQEKTIRPIINRAVEVTEGKLIDYRFNPLDVPTRQEQAQTLSTVADAVTKLIATGVISPMEARNMFSGQEIKMVPVLLEQIKENLPNG